MGGNTIDELLNRGDSETFLSQADSKSVENLLRSIEMIVFSETMSWI